MKTVFCTSAESDDNEMRESSLEDKRKWYCLEQQR